MEEDYFTYKVAAWLIFMLLTLQPAGTYESLTDDWTAATTTETPSYQEAPASVDEALPLQTAFALRLRSLHAPHPTISSQNGKSVLFPAHSTEPQPHLSASDFIRRRSTLCIYRI